MKELENRIFNLWIEETNDYAFARRLSQEVKDIAKEFADYVNQQQTFFQIDRTPDQMFNDFIKERYKP